MVNTKAIFFGQGLLEVGKALETSFVVQQVLTAETEIATWRSTPLDITAAGAEFGGLHRWLNTYKRMASKREARE